MIDARLAGIERIGWRRQQLCLSLVLEGNAKKSIGKIPMVETERRQLKQEGEEKKNVLEAREYQRLSPPAGCSHAITHGEEGNK